MAATQATSLDRGRADKAVLGILSEDVDPFIPSGMALFASWCSNLAKAYTDWDFSCASLRYDEPHYGRGGHTHHLEIDNHSSLSLGILRLSMLRTVVLSIPFSQILLGYYRFAESLCPQSFLPLLHFFRSTLFSERF
jgi:hypothetical protein